MFNRLSTIKEEHIKNVSTVSQSCLSSSTLRNMLTKLIKSVNFKEAVLQKILRRNPPDVGVTRGQKPSTKIIYIVLQTSVGLPNVENEC